jgi:hypothetical protein
VVYKNKLPQQVDFIDSRSNNYTKITNKIRELLKYVLVSLNAKKAKGYDQIQKEQPLGNNACACV